MCHDVVVVPKGESESKEHKRVHERARERESAGEQPRANTRQRGSTRSRAPAAARGRVCENQTRQWAGERPRGSKGAREGEKEQSETSCSVRETSCRTQHVSWKETCGMHYIYYENLAFFLCKILLSSIHT